MTEFKTWSNDEVLLWANSEKLPYSYLDFIREQKIVGSSLSATAEYLNESHDENEKRFILNSLNFLKKEGPSPTTFELIELFRIMKNPYYNSVLAQESQSDKVTYQLLKNMNETFNAQGGSSKFQKFLKNQNFTRLSPLFTCHLLQEGEKDWVDAVRSYKSYAKKQNFVLPSYTLLQNLFNSPKIASYKQQHGVSNDDAASPMKQEESPTRLSCIEIKSEKELLDMDTLEGVLAMLLVTDKQDYRKELEKSLEAIHPKEPNLRSNTEKYCPLEQKIEFLNELRDLMNTERRREPDVMEVETPSIDGADVEVKNENDLDIDFGDEESPVDYEEIEL